MFRASALLRGVRPFTKPFHGQLTDAYLSRRQHIKALSSVSPPADRFPTREDGRLQVRHYHEMNGDTLLILAARGDRAACRERLVREVMFVDDLDWPAADARVTEMDAQVQAPALLQTTSRGVVATSLFAAGASVPLVFHHDLALWFNERYVTDDVPLEKDLETWLEVGAWTWNWMEPPLGTISFVLLCVQLAHSYGLSNPVAGVLLRRRERDLLERFPKYSTLILRQWADSDLKADLDGKPTATK
jgi:hypothetical protein